MSNQAQHVVAAVFTEASGDYCEFRDLALAAPNAGELVIKVGATGICHTDIACASYVPRPAVLGHELAGDVIACGTGVSGFDVGDRIVATFGYCGDCGSCRDQSPAYCEDHARLNFDGCRPDGSASCYDLDGTPQFSAFFQQSGFADHAIVQAASAVKLPSTMPFSIAAPLGCGVQTGAGTILRSLNCQPDRSIVIFGLGTVGLVAIMAAKLRGCGPIIAVDIVAERIEKAKSLGADHGLNGRSATLLREIRELTGGAHYSVEGTGRVEIYQAAINCLRPNGVCGLLTHPGPFGEPVPHPGGMALLNTRQIGIIEGDSDVHTFLPELIELQTSGALPYEQLIETYAFREINDALDALREKRVFKPVLTFET